MVKLWGKLVSDDKIVKTCTLDKDINFSLINFIDYIIEISYMLDIPTPVILKSHLKNFFNFNNVKFVPSDFVEKFDYDEFIIENAVIAE